MITRTVLVTGADAATREAGISSLIDAGSAAAATAVILEGIAPGREALEKLSTRPNLSITRIAPGCLCCTGNLTLRVSLNRMLRQRPALLYISLADSAHLDRIESFLSQPSYAAWLTLDDRLSYSDVR